MLHILSAEQAHTLENIRNNPSCSTVKYIDGKVAVDTLYYSLLADLQAGKSVQITCRDQGLKNELITKFVESGLNDYLIEADSATAIPDRKISKLRSNYKSKHTKTGTKEEHYKLSFLCQEIADNYKNLNSKVIGDIKLADLPLVMTRKNNNITTQFLKSSQISKIASTEDINYHHLLGVIHDLSFKYRPIFEELKTSEILNDQYISTLTDEIAIRNLATKLSELVGNNNKLMSLYTDIKESYESKFYNSKTQKVQNNIDFLRSTLIKVSSMKAPAQKDGGFSIFKKKKIVDTGIVSDQLVEINDYLIDQNCSWQSHLSQDLSTVQELEDYLVKLLGLAKTVITNADRSDSASITKHLSLLNQKDDMWHSAAQQLNNHINQLNELGILKDKVENNSKALSQQIDLVHRINTKLQHLSYRLQNHDDYYLFQAELSVSILKNTIVECLKHIPTENWREVYDSANFVQITKQYKTVDLPHEGQQLNRLLTQYKAAEIEILTRIDDSISQIQKTSLDSISKGQKQLFQSLIKKKLPLQSTAIELTAHFFDISKSLFPIHITTSCKPTYDVTYVLGDIEFDEENVKAFFTPFNEEDFKDMSSEKAYTPLYLNHYQYTDSIEKLSNTDKIKAAKKLAKLVLSSNQNIKIYQLRTANIISLLPYQDDQILESQLIDHDAKNMDLDDVYNRLVESILTTDRAQHMIIKDGLLRSDKVETIAFQKDTIQKLISAGIQISSIYTIDQLRSNISDPITVVSSNITGIKTEKEIINTLEENIEELV